MYGSTAVASKEDLNLPCRSRDVLPESNSNLLRYRSAPSSLLGELCDDFLPGMTTSSTGFLGPDLQIGNKTSGSFGAFRRNNNYLLDLSSNNSAAWEINSSLELQNGDRNHVSGLSPQFSLPNTSSEMVNLERYWEFQDAMPCKVHAKRGCATHPRSIAERVRRTRISERIRKLQELVPNMDKQTNTSEMLDLAVSYIKDLQKQVKELSEKRASCSCSVGKQ